MKSAGLHYGASLRGGPIALQDVGSAGSPLAFHRLCGCRHRQCRRLDATGETNRLGGPLGAAPARLAPAERSLLVRAAVCSQMERRATYRRIGLMRHFIAD